MNSDDRTMTKNLQREQAKSGNKNCWYGNIKDEGKSLSLKQSEEVVVGKPKFEWKRMMKLKTNKAFER